MIRNYALMQKNQEEFLIHVNTALNGGVKYIIKYCDELVDMARRICDVFGFLTMSFCSPPSGLTGPSDITFLRASWLWSLLSLAGGGRLSD